MHQLAPCAARSRSRRFEPRGPQQRHVNGRRGHREALIGADVGGRLAAADVLLARLQGQREARPAFGIECAPDDAPRHLAHVLHARRHEAEVGTARGERHAERLAFAAHDVGAPFGRPCPRPTRPGGFSNASEVGLTTAMTSKRCSRAPNRSARRSLPGCRRNSAAAPPAPRNPRRRRARSASSVRAPGAPIEVHAFELDVLMAGDRSRHLARKSGSRCGASGCAATSSRGSRAPPSDTPRPSAEAPS